MFESCSGVMSLHVLDVLTSRLHSVSIFIKVRYWGSAPASLPYSRSVRAIHRSQASLTVFRLALRLSFEARASSYLRVERPQLVSRYALGLCP